MTESAYRTFRRLVRQGKLRSVGTQVMVTAAVLLVAALLLLWVSYDHLQNSFETDRRTDAALLLINRVEAKLVGAEMTVRGYALTGEPSFLQWGVRERRDAVRALSDLQAAMLQEPGQAARFRAMHRLVQQRLDLYAYLSQPAHAKAVARAIVDPKTRDVMRQARQELGALRQAQLDLLEARQQETAAAARSNLYLASGIVILAFLLVVLGIVMTQGGDVKPEL